MPPLSARAVWARGVTSVTKGKVRPHGHSELGARTRPCEAHLEGPAAGGEYLGCGQFVGELLDLLLLLNQQLLDRG